MSTPPGEVPPPPPPQPAASPTRIAGQENAPTSEVPMGPATAYAQPSVGSYNTMAVVSVVAGALSIFVHIVLPIFGGASVALVAVVTGWVGRQQIKTSGEKGMWMANLGLILGVVHFALLILIFIVIILLVFVFGFAMLGFHR